MEQPPPSDRVRNLILLEGQALSNGYDLFCRSESARSRAEYK